MGLDHKPSKGRVAQDQMPRNEAEPFLLKSHPFFTWAFQRLLCGERIWANHDSSPKFSWVAHQKQQELKTRKLEQHTQCDFSHGFAPQSHAKEIGAKPLSFGSSSFAMSPRCTWILHGSDILNVLDIWRKSSSQKALQDRKKLIWLRVVSRHGHASR